MHIWDYGRRRDYSSGAAPDRLAELTSKRRVGRRRVCLCWLVINHFERALDTTRQLHNVHGSKSEWSGRGDVRQRVVDVLCEAMGTASKIWKH